MMRRKHPGQATNHYRNAGGFTIMEVLVALIIFSIGLLGVAGLQLNSLRGNQAALEASVAVSLASEGADRLRSNLPGIRNPDTGTSFHYYDLITAPGTDPGCITTTCTPEQIAQTDAFELISRVQERLPGGEAVICRDSTPMDGTNSTNHQCDQDPATEIFAVKVWWDHDRDPNTDMMFYSMLLVP